MIVRLDKANAKRAERNTRKRERVQEIRDRRRFSEAPVPTGIVKKRVPATAAGTVYPHTVMDWSPDCGERIFKDGRDNSKIGGDVMTGRLKGARIFTLSLEERATCPKACRLWTVCYGNQMNQARRWRYGRALEDGIRAEIATLCAENGKVLIRLHVLGDFASWRYLCLWADLLDEHPNLYVFGFTAHRPGTKIGDGIVRLRTAMPDRFCMRLSEASGPWTSLTIDFPTEQARIGDAIVCPEQREAISDPEKRRHCGNCGLCWRGDKPIAFIKH